MDSDTESKQFSGVRYPGFRTREPRLIAVGLVLLVIGSIALYNTNALHSYQSSFNVLAGKFFKISSNLRDQTLITGSFRETSGRTITFYLMSSIQFAAFQLGQGNSSLFFLKDVPTGSVSFTSTIADTYYLVFAHGAGLLNQTETVNFQRSYVSLDEFQLGSGIALLFLGALVLYWGLRPRHRLPEITHSPSPVPVK